MRSNIGLLTLIWWLLGNGPVFAQAGGPQSKLFFSIDSDIEPARLDYNELALHEDGAECKISGLEPTDCGLSKRPTPGIVAVLLDASNMLAGNPGAESMASKALKRISVDAPIAVYTLDGSDFTIYRDFELLSGREYEHVIRADQPIDAASRVFRKMPSANPHRRTIIPFQDVHLRDLSVIESIAHHLDAMPGHKSLVWYCSENGFSKTPPTTNSRLRDAWLAAFTAVEKANLSIYPIKCLYDIPDLSGPSNIRWLPSKDHLPEAPRSPQTRDPDWAEKTVRGLAELTGGKYFLGDNQLEKAVHLAIADNQRSCSLSWKVPNPPAIASISQIMVLAASNQATKLRYPEVHIQRSTAPEDESARISDLERCLSTQLTQRSLLIDATLQSSGTGIQKHFELLAKVTLPPHLRASEIAELDVLLIFLDKDGQRLPQGIKTVIHPTALKGVADISLMFEAPLGARQVRLALRDKTSHNVGSADISLR